MTHHEYLKELGRSQTQHARQIADISRTDNAHLCHTAVLPLLYFPSRQSFAHLWPALLDDALATYAAVKPIHD